MEERNIYTPAALCDKAIKILRLCLINIYCNNEVMEISNIKVYFQLYVEENVAIFHFY